MAGGIPWPTTDTTQYHKQFGPPDKDRAIKELVVWLRNPAFLKQDLVQKYTKTRPNSMTRLKDIANVF